MSSTRTNRSRAGFTLLEILLAVAILSIVITAVYNTWSAALNGWRRGSDASEVFQRQRVVMDVLTELTQSTVFFTASAPLYTVVGTKNPGLGDSVSFVTASDAFLPPSEATDAGMRRVTISVEEDQYHRTYLAIVNQPALRPDDTTAEPLQAHVVSMDVSGFFVRYLDPRDGTWSDKWEEPNVPPLAMEYTVVFGHQGDRLPPVVVTRAVDIPVAPFIAQGPGLGGMQNSTNQVQRRDIDVSALTGNTGAQPSLP